MITHYSGRTQSILIYLVALGLWLTGVTAFADAVIFDYLGVKFTADAPKHVDVTCTNCERHVMQQAVTLFCPDNREDEAKIDTQPAYYTCTTSRLPVCALCYDRLVKLEKIVSDKHQNTGTDDDQSYMSGNDGKSSEAQSAVEQATPSATDPSAIEGPNILQAHQSRISSYDYEVCRHSGTLSTLLSFLKVPVDAQGRPSDAFGEKLSLESETLHEYTISCQLCHEEIALGKALKEHAEQHRVTCEKCYRVLISPTIESGEQGQIKQAHQDAGCLLPCQYCEADIPRYDLQDHFNVCEKRAVSCPLCKKTLNGGERFNHYFTHPDKTITCDTCQHQVDPLLYPAHTINYCPPAVVCPECSGQYASEAWLNHLVRDHSSSGIYSNLCSRSDFDCPQAKKVFDIIKRKSSGSLSSPQQSSAVEQSDESPGNLSGTLIDTRLDRPALSSRADVSANKVSIIWKITDVHKKWSTAKEENPDTPRSLYSPPFYTSPNGYKLCARLYLNGDGLGKDHYVSMFIVMMKSDYDPLNEWPFAGHEITFAILDLDNKGEHISVSFLTDGSSSSFKKPQRDMNIASGYPQFASQSYIYAKNSPYIKDDAMFVQIIINTTQMKQPGVTDR